MFGIISGMDIGLVWLLILKIIIEIYNLFKKDLNEFGFVE